ncbi:sensory box histidine kinase PhoR [Actinoallomurus bryophytorum]|uniref:histidine kinase n=1 Tax=Actinoallomurus bryophytorum TaxID=1490222 RepID=A0A543CKY7_9ACTN|nr:HAMP domain-containing sensor histidine kinase [Actinoallomurus bryophytorum]TQL97761.1 two-component system OmpR family sensor kinase [Actinoallomurus bryophytorum]
MSLRMRILAGLVGLLVLGLAAFGVGINRLMKGKLENQLDQQLVAVAGTVRQVLVTDKDQRGLDRLFDMPFPERKVPPDPDLPLPRKAGAGILEGPQGVSDLAAFPPGLVVEVRSQSGTLLDRQMFPSKMRVEDLPAGRPTVAPTGPGHRRTLTTTMHEGGTPVLVTLAIPIAPVDGVLGQLTVIELVLGVIIVVIGAGLALVVARVTARPLARIAATADAISGGDLTRRVPDRNPKTEVGRVGLALNAMLGEIQRYVERLVESEQRMRRFLGDASHELATPLTSIRGYSELFRSGAQDRPEDLARAMSRIEAEAARMTGLVEELLLLAELDEGRPLRPARVDLRAIAADAVDDARLAAPDRTIELEATAGLYVHGEENRLRQVAANLLSNACRHTPPGTPITVTAAPGVLEVADDGPGMDAVRAARVFDRFYGDGSGLGLAIVASIVAAHGGTVQVTSAPGEGTTFRVELPPVRESDRILTGS